MSLPSNGSSVDDPGLVMRGHPSKESSPHTSRKSSGAAEAASVEKEDPARKRTPDDFVFGRVLGEGSYSTVLYAKEISTQREYAVKVLDKHHIIKEKKIKYVNIEKDVLHRLSHPLIVKLYYTFQDAHSLYFVLEYAKDGDLLGFIRKLGSFKLEDARFYVAEIIEAVEHLHSINVIHRDLKPENILLDDRMHIKITDFGTAKILDDDQETKVDTKRNSFVGTAEYCSPELLNNRAASTSSDIWAIGCILFHLLAGKPPFKGANEYQTFQKIIKLDYTFPDGFPESARDLVSSILVLDAAARPSLADLRKHPFFADFVWDDLPSQTAPDLRPFLPATSDHNMEDLTSELACLTTGTGQFHGDIELSRDPFEEIPSTDSADKLKTLKEQAKSPLRPLVVAPTEVILMEGIVHKRKGLFSKKRGLVLTDLPRLLFFDETKSGPHPKSEIPWIDKLKVELKDPRHFFVHTAKRTYYLETVNAEDAQLWVNAIEKQLQATKPS
ncbi:3-phosphoinositide-dependent protein kinase 1-like protein [Fimicolochytrium jonesii]|uniref:3-phosphoinositide-dependent protein kinase 1-like protein n=1 Tax=Fimicolochytrium jonesii TaxID=1396493 RepID=UPI0022FDB80C|nr:3-phosphoinositide-dependent protein kinase 1-like protein [Fimicolochytrium jonesii]KAI8826809.1 3-phosphoinositide-dependent protein kinase 1-like protein [Fimicolochytrium jonesii]